jgi:anti-anti-sigma regulatory factor
MSTPSASLSVYARERQVCIRINGRANFLLGAELKQLLDVLHTCDFSRFIFELSECSLMDSTILGTLTGFGLKQRQKLGEGSESNIELRNATLRVAELIENLGVAELFALTTGPVGELQRLEILPHHSGQPTREEITRASLEAHLILEHTSVENAARFKDVTRFLAEDLKRIQEKKSGEH